MGTSFGMIKNSSEAGFEAILPEELIIEILSWLPVKSLFRLKCVCKSWYALPNNSHFISKHLHNSTIRTQNQGLIIFHHKNPDESIDKNTLTLLSGETTLDIEVPKEFEKSKHVEISGPCNGIYCVCTENGIALWNPCIREFKLLPQHNIPCDVPKNLTQCCYGIGFDYMSNDYKVVKTLFSYNGRQGLFGIYSLKTNSWKTMDVHHESAVRLRYPCLNSKGVLYWVRLVTVETSLMPKSLFAFDMGNEKFLEIPPPMDICNEKSSWAISPLNQSIALVAFNFGLQTTRQWFDVWMMKEDNKKYSWTMLHRIGPVPHISFPFGFQRNGELVLLGGGKVIIFNPKSLEIKNVRVSGRGQVLFYEESLISFKGVSSR